VVRAPGINVDYRLFLFSPPMFFFFSFNPNLFAQLLLSYFIGAFGRRPSGVIFLAFPPRFLLERERFIFFFAASPPYSPLIVFQSSLSAGSPPNIHALRERNPPFPSFTNAHVFSPFPSVRNTAFAPPPSSCSCSLLAPPFLKPIVFLSSH